MSTFTNSCSSSSSVPSTVLHQSHQQFFISPINSSSSVPSTVLHQSHQQFFISPINSSSSVPSSVLHQSHHQFFISLIISSSSVPSSKHVKEGIFVIFIRWHCNSKETAIVKASASGWPTERNGSLPLYCGKPQNLAGSHNSLLSAQQSAFPIQYWLWY